jgi:hypothetical protein
MKSNNIKSAIPITMIITKLQKEADKMACDYEKNADKMSCDETAAAIRSFTKIADMSAVLQAIVLHSMVQQRPPEELVAYLATRRIIYTVAEVIEIAKMVEMAKISGQAISRENLNRLHALTARRFLNHRN